MGRGLVRFGRRLWFRLRRNRLESELAEELEFHASLSSDPREMGNITLAREQSRDLWSFLAIERFWQDIRYALRTFRKDPGFTAVAVVSLALGIGGNAAVFSLVNTLLIRPLPYAEPDRLMRITEVYPKAAYVVIRGESRTMDVASVSAGQELNLTGQGEAIRVFGSPVSSNFFAVLGASVARGRGFQPGEDQPGRDALVILSHGLWSSQFGGDPSVIGRVVAFNGVNRQVIGVTPPNFHYPSSRIQFWIPTRIDPTLVFDDYWGGEFAPLIGRLRPGATLEQARNELPGMVTQIRGMFPFPMKRNWNAEATVTPLQEDIVGNARGKLLVLLSSVGIVLLIACANVASLLLSRATTRRKEIALRAALGAGRGRIIRQLLTESVLLASIGGALGLVIGNVALGLVRAVLPAEIPGVATAAIDWQVLGFSAGLAIVTGLVFGLAPALNAAQLDLTDSIKTGSQRSTTQRWGQLRSWLIAAEVALTVVLVIAAGLLMKTLFALTQVDPGYRTERLLAVRVSPDRSACLEPAKCIALYDELKRRAASIGGVSEVALANTVPMDGRFTAAAIAVDVEDHPKGPDFPAPMFWGGVVSPEYTRLMNIHLRAGRELSHADGPTAPPVILISAATAKLYWPGQNPIGKHIKSAGEGRFRTVVGVVDDVRQADLANRGPNFITGDIYVPYAQATLNGRTLPVAMNLVVKTMDDPVRIGSEVRRLAIEQNPSAPVSEPRTLDSLVSGSIENRRSTMGLFLSFALVAVVLAAVGIYGLVAYSVSQRTYEIGLRMAIGATKRDVLGMILGQSLRVTLVGIGAGIAVAAVLTRFLASLLYGVTTHDPLTFVTVAVLLFVTTLAASSVPAWRAAQTDPSRSLRAE